jgi:hypothetical protein
MTGFKEFDKSIIPQLRRDFDFYKVLHYKEHFLKMESRGTVSTNDGWVNVLELTDLDGRKTAMTFDINSGLLRSVGELAIEDYRSVGTLKVPFTTRISIAGLQLVIKLEQVTNNATISPDKFKEIESCFTRP